jgi:hypothetical protein
LKLDGGTIAALVTTAAAVAAIVSSALASAGRNRTYRRLGEFLTMRGQVPDELT